MRHSIRLALLIPAALLVLCTLDLGEADAQYRRRTYRARPATSVGVYVVPRGLYFGAGLVGAKILDQSGGPELLEDGIGLTLFGGLRLSRVLALELGWVGTFHNPETVDVGFGPETDYLVLNGATIDAKIYLLGQGDPSPQGQPYIQGGVGVYFLDSTTFGTDSVGTGFQLGGGYDFFIGDNLNLGLRGLYRGMAMGPPDSNFDDTFVSALSLEGNLTIEF
jgi:hypothetical protein